MATEVETATQSPQDAPKIEITDPGGAKADSAEVNVPQIGAKDLTSDTLTNGEDHAASSSPHGDTTSPTSTHTEPQAPDGEKNPGDGNTQTEQGKSESGEDVDTPGTVGGDTQAKKDVADALNVEDQPVASETGSTDDTTKEVGHTAEHDEGKKDAHDAGKDEDAISVGSSCGDELNYKYTYDKQLEERIKKAPTRVRQFADYIKLMEDRMEAMEEQLLKLNPKPPKPEPEPEPEPAPVPETQQEPEVEAAPPPPPKRQLLLEIAHMKWPVFSGTEDSTQTQTHVIEVLIGDPDHLNPPPRKKKSKIQEEKKEKSDEMKEKQDEKEDGKEKDGKEKDSKDKDSKVSGTTTQTRPSTVQEKRSIMPERVSINSDLLINILKDITSTEIQGPLMILRPFKLLLHWEPEIRQRLKTLEERWEVIDAQKAKELEEELAEKEKSRLAAGSKDPNSDAGSAADGTSDAPMKDISEPAEASNRLEKNDVSGGTVKENDTVKSPDSTKKEVAKVQAHENKDDLADDLVSIYGKPALNRLRLLVKFMDQEIFAPLSELKNSNGPKQVYFADLYHLFPPGEEVVETVGSRADNEAQVYRILQCTGGRRYNDAETLKQEDESLEFKPLERCSPFVISCVHVDYNGTELGPVTSTFTIKEFVGQRSTSTLPVVPWLFLSAPTLRQKVQERGNRFLELAAVSHKDYTGPTIEPREDIDSQVIVDFSSTFQLNPDWMPTLDVHYPSASDSRETAAHNPNDTPVEVTKGEVLDCYNYMTYWMHEDASIDQTRMKDYIADRAIFRRDRPVVLKASEDSVELDVEDRILLPSRVFGFVLRSRTWAALSINLVKDRAVRPDGFNQLVLPRGHKELVQALVETHSRESRSNERPAESGPKFDLVKGKGKGLIILCHGVPGVGKTSTAECIADYTKRPLFPITCGDIGETASSVETNLAKHFQLAHKWGCVLLLDEADVFMAKRVLGSANDIQRNSLVSVFLRVLEVGTFDPAFKSRIHISLYYPPLDRTATISIWKVNMNRLRTSNKEYEIDEDGIIQYAEEHFDTNNRDGRWNGRQIRNAFQTAVALAEFEANNYVSRSNVSHARGPAFALKPQVAVRHFEQVARAATMFDHYLKEVHGGQTDADLARKKAERKDDFDQQPIAQMAPPSSRRAAPYQQQQQQQQQQTPRQLQPQLYPASNGYPRAAAPAPPFDDRATSPYATDAYAPRRSIDLRRPDPRLHTPADNNNAGYDVFDDPSRSSAYLRQQQPQQQQVGTPILQHGGRPPPPAQDDRFQPLTRTMTFEPEERYQTKAPPQTSASNPHRSMTFVDPEDRGAGN
ncbi:MAG: hypothetical protein Q9195_009338, partial [Heterodermia aff. obscurata]